MVKGTYIQTSIHHGHWGVGDESLPPKSQTWMEQLPGGQSTVLFHVQLLPMNPEVATAQAAQGIFKETLGLFM